MNAPVTGFQIPVGALFLTVPPGRKTVPGLLWESLGFAALMDREGYDGIARAEVERIGAWLARPATDDGPTDKVQLPDRERGRGADDVRRLDRLNAKLARTDLKDKQREAAVSERIALERAPAESAEKAWREAAHAETLALAELRGDEIAVTARPGERVKLLRRQSGLDWLWSKGRLETHQMAAGMKYGDLYRRSTDVTLRSCVAGDVGGGSGDTPQDTRMAAQDSLESARESLSNHPEMVTLCDHVAGEGARLRTLADGDDQLASKFEAVLKVALDLLAAHFGMRTR